MRFCAVLRHHPKDKPGGSEYQAHLITKSLSQMGHETHYLAYRSGNKSRVVDESVTVHRESYKPIRDLPKVIKKLIEIDADVYYFRLLSDLPLASLLKKYTRKPVIFQVSHDAVCSSTLSPWPNLGVNSVIKRALLQLRIVNYRLLLSIPDQVLVQKKTQSELLSKNHNINSIIVGNGHPIPNAGFTKHSPPVVLWLASIKGWKQPLKFLELAEECSDVPCEFWIVGRRADEELSNEVISRTQKMENVYYKGACSISESNDYIGRASLFVNTSIQEGFPNTFIQCWLRKTPVLSLNVDINSHLIDNEAGSLCPTINDLSQAVKKFITNDSYRESTSLTARRIAERNYSINSVAEKIESVCEKEIGRNSY
ncbi:glycosyltransferase family 4 protein [Salinigranum halophilum]|uniref:glycosyltransferase family 4 protein n=1 Tax=Salinigranum halophilum TaxID=2565931 RepID=UPI0010A8D857|nr:glycosyltransferase family 4 protein [Salinigranum halophilum]